MAKQSVSKPRHEVMQKHGAKGQLVTFCPRCGANHATGGPVRTLGARTRTLGRMASRK